MLTKLAVQLYDNNLTGPTFIADLGNRCQNLQFGTKLHGGFNQCSFTLNQNRGTNYQYAYMQPNYRVVVTSGGNTLYEGRIQDPMFDAAGNPGFTAYGYYASLDDQYYYTSYSNPFDTVLKAMLTGACPLISGDQTQINAGALTLSTVVSTADTSYLDQSVRSLAEKLVQQSDTAFNKWYMAVWENRRFYLFTRKITPVTWTVQLKHFKTAQWLLQTQNLWNDVYGIYTSGGNLTRTSEYPDANSIAAYGLTRKYAIPNLGAVSAASVAQNTAQSWLGYYKTIWPSATNIDLYDKVFDSWGCMQPSWRVRAGDVICISDLVPATANALPTGSNAINTFYITETKYDFANMTNTLTFETKSLDLYALLAGSIQPVVV